MAAPSPQRLGRRFRITGLVQGVGFRPHVWRIATGLGLVGHVLNDGQGVEIEAWGEEQTLDNFAEELTSKAPPLSRIDGLRAEEIQDQPGQDQPGKETFEIIESRRGVIATGVVADAATCPVCLDDILDPKNHRHRYAFTNCTHCGPRLSIVKQIPYDRAHTSMAAFTMCPACRAEYEAPADRRFHAQPNACPDCGPRLWLEDVKGEVPCNDPCLQTAELIRVGAIVAIKGIGGFHLACDATSELVVGQLRSRKHRPTKPLALMARDIEMVRQFADVTETEAALLESPAAPIVLLKALPDSKLARGIAPGQDRIGFMLPYTPLHHLLMRAVDGPIVLTSGNLTDEPQATDNEEARMRLLSIADYWLTHDRDIVTRLDDSVMRLDVTGPAILRRARGLAPEPLRLNDAFRDAPNVLAMGGELKSTFCLLQKGQAILSQHIGDLEHPAVHADYRKSLEFYRHAFDFHPDIIAVDRHPNYFSTELGQALANELGAKVVEVQHHHAHMTACLADNAIAPDDDASIGIIFDGLGLGDDGTIWGGEVLVGGYRSYKRVAYFQPVALPGGELAMRQPWRNAVAHLHAAFGTAYPGLVSGTKLAEILAAKQLEIVHKAIEGGINSPLASSAGRLFDAVAAVLGECSAEQTFEGEAAMRLEVLARTYAGEERGYPVGMTLGSNSCTLTWPPMWGALLSDLKRGMEVGRVAARFHQTLIETCVSLAKSLAAQHKLSRCVLSGGVMQNQVLSEGLFKRLSDAGLTVLTHRRVPANDGGLALGQAVTASMLAQDWR